MAVLPELEFVTEKQNVETASEPDFATAPPLYLYSKENTP